FLPDRGTAGAGRRGESPAGKGPGQAGLRGHADGPADGGVPDGGKHLPVDVPGSRRPGVVVGGGGIGRRAVARRVGAARRAGPVASPGLSTVGARLAGVFGKQLLARPGLGGRGRGRAAGGGAASARRRGGSTLAPLGGTARPGAGGGADGRRRRGG